MSGSGSDEAGRLRQMALERQAAGRFEEAYQLLRRRAMLSPEDAGAWADIAECLTAARMPEDALKAWDAALAVAPGDAALLGGKAGVLQGLGRAAEARSLLDKAVATAPGDAGVGLQLARLAIEAGDWDEAARLAGGIEQGRAEGQWLKARIALGRGHFEEAERQAAHLCADPRLAPEPRADALLLWAEALDRLGQPSRAFQAASQGKLTQRRLFADRAAGREGAVARLARLRAELAKADRADWAVRTEPARAPGEPRVHAFILGFPRSGTTLLEQALAGHPDVIALEEPPTLAAPAAEFLSSPEGLERLARLAPAQIAAWRARYFAEVRALGPEPSGKVLVDKAPAETSSLPLIARLFPDARILFALRDPREVVLSCFMSSFQMNALTYAFTDLGETARAYAATMTLAETCRQLLPLNLTEVRHEALVEDFETVLAGVAAALGLDLHPAMINIAATARARTVRTPSAALVRGGLTTARLGRWRAYAAELEPVLPALRPWVERFGYAG